MAPGQSDADDMTPSRIAAMLDVRSSWTSRELLGDCRILVAFVSYSLPSLVRLAFLVVQNIRLAADVRAPQDAMVTRRTVSTTMAHRHPCAPAKARKSHQAPPRP
jgi:hypothetical protein